MGLDSVLVLPGIELCDSGHRLASLSLVFASAAWAVTVRPHAEVGGRGGGMEGSPGQRAGLQGVLLGPAPQPQSHVTPQGPVCPSASLIGAVILSPIRQTGTLRPTGSSLGMDACSRQPRAGIQTRPTPVPARELEVGKAEPSPPGQEAGLGWGCGAQISGVTLGLNQTATHPCEGGPDQ